MTSSTHLGDGAPWMAAARMDDEAPSHTGEAVWGEAGGRRGQEEIGSSAGGRVRPHTMGLDGVWWRGQWCWWLVEALSSRGSRAAVVVAAMYACWWMGT